MLDAGDWFKTPTAKKDGLAGKCLDRPSAITGNAVAKINRLCVTSPGLDSGAPAIDERARQIFAAAYAKHRETPKFIAHAKKYGIAHGGDRRSESAIEIKSANGTLDIEQPKPRGSNSRAYMAERLAKDAPALSAKVADGTMSFVDATREAAQRMSCLIQLSQSRTEARPALCSSFGHPNRQATRRSHQAANVARLTWCLDGPAIIAQPFQPFARAIS